MRSKFGLALALVAGVGLWGCNLVKQAQSNQIMEAQLLATPPESVGGQTVDSKVVANVFLGTRDPAHLTAAPAPTTGAQVHVEFNGTQVPLAESGDGNYTATDGIAYQAGTTYRFVAVVDGETFAENVVAPEPETIAEFHQGVFAPDAGFSVYPDGGTSFDGGFPFLEVNAGEDLTLNRENFDPANANIALTVVTPVDDDGVGDPTFTAPSLDAQGVINLLLNASKYKQPTVTIDGSKAWPTCQDSGFLITVTGLKTGSVEGTNLFLGSTVLAGSADAAPARCP